MKDFLRVEHNSRQEASIKGDLGDDLVHSLSSHTAPKYDFAYIGFCVWLELTLSEPLRGFQYTLPPSWPESITWSMVFIYLTFISVVIAALLLLNIPNFDLEAVPTATANVELTPDLNDDESSTQTTPAPADDRDADKNRNAIDDTPKGKAVNN